MTKSKEDNRTTTTTTSRFGGSVYRSKSRSFTKETPETVTKTSEFTLNDAISPVSATRNTKNNGSNGRDLLAEISFDDSRNNVSIYESVASSSANSSFDVMHSSSPTRYPQSKHVSFDGSNVSDPASPDKRGNHSTNGRRGEVTPDRIVSLSPIYANDQKASRMSSTSTAVSIDDESDVTVPTSNLVTVDHVAVKSFSSKPTQSMDDASMSSQASFDEFGVARNAYETSTNRVSKTVTTAAISTNTSEDTNDTQTEELNGDTAKVDNAQDVSNISEPSNLTGDSTAHEPKKASWMKYLRPLNVQESEEKVEDQQSDILDNEPVLSVWKPSRPFEMVNMYQDPKEITPVLFMVESKRQCWFQQEMDAIRREWQYYKKLIRDNVQEVIRVEDMLRSSHDAFCDYVKHIDDMIVDLYVNEHGELLSKKEKTKMLKRRSDAGITSSSGTSGDLHKHDRDTVDDMKDLNVWLTPMIESFSTVQGEIKTQLPFFEECLMDVISLKQEMRARGKELDEKGNTLNLHVMEQAESNIQDSFDALMNVIDELERTQREEMRKAKALASSIGSTTGSSSDGVLRSFVDETKTDEPFQIHDRWLYESQYRYAAKLGLLSWKENRKDYEFWYAEIIALHEERKCRLNEVLLSFLPRRKELLLKLHVALMSGSESLDETKISTAKETRAIDKAIERNAVIAMKNDPSKYADLTMDVVFFNPKVKSSTGAASTKYARSSTDLWKSALIRERRLVELKVNKDEYKLAVCIVTLDDSMHVFIMTDDLLNDTSTSGTTTTSNNTTIPFDPSVTTQPLDYYTKRMSTSVTTKIPPVEYSIKLLDYDISIVGDTNDTNNSSKNPFGSSSEVKIPTELELLRKARSVIFRKREDHITIRVPSKKDAVKFLRNRLPVGERLTEI